MADEKRRALVHGQRRRGRHDRGPHAPRDQQVGAHLSEQPAHVAAVAGELAAGADVLRHAAAQLERALAQRHHLDALGARPLGEPALGAGQHQSAGQTAREVEQRALRAPQQAGVSDGQRQHDRQD